MRLLVFGTFCLFFSVMGFVEFYIGWTLQESAASSAGHDSTRGIWIDLSALHFHIGLAFCFMGGLASQTYRYLKDQSDRIKVLEQQVAERIHE